VAVTASAAAVCSAGNGVTPRPSAADTASGSGWYPRFDRFGPPPARRAHPGVRFWQVADGWRVVNAEPGCDICHWHIPVCHCLVVLSGLSRLAYTTVSLRDGLRRRRNYRRRASERTTPSQKINSRRARAQQTTLKPQQTDSQRGQVRHCHETEQTPGRAAAAGHGEAAIGHHLRPAQGPGCARLSASRTASTRWRIPPRREPPRRWPPGVLPGPLGGWRGAGRTAPTGLAGLVQGN